MPARVQGPGSLGQQAGWSLNLRPPQERKAKQEGDKARREEARTRVGEALPELADVQAPSWQLPPELEVRLDP